MLVVSLTLVNADHSGNSIDYCVHIRSCCDLRTFPPKNLNDDFWAGLKLMSTLTQNGQWEMRVDFQKNDKTWSYLHNNQFSVGSPSDEYRLTVGGYTGEVEIISQQGMNLQIILNLPLTIMTMMLPVVIVQPLINLDGGTRAALTLIQTINHLIMIGQTLHYSLR